MVRAAAYARISSDRREQRVGVGEQHQRLDAYIAQRWPDATVTRYDDNDLSGSDPDVDRPGYTALVAAVRRGDVDVIVCQEQSRLTRQPSQWEELCVTLTRAGIEEVHSLKGTVSVAPQGRLLGRVMAAVDAEESERIRARMLLKHETLRQEGRPGGGRPYGYRPGRDDRGRATLDVVAEHAAVVRRIFDRYLAGDTTPVIAAALNADGVPTARGAPQWSHAAVTAVLRSEAVAGRRGGAPAVWEPIVDAATWDAVQARRRLPSQWRTGGRADTFPYLLAGVAVCGACGWRLRGNRQWRRPPQQRVPSYQCRRINDDPAPSDGGPCSGVSIGAHLLEPLIVAAVLTLAADPETVAARTGADTVARDRHAAELAAADATLADLATAYGNGEIGAAEWRAARSGALRRQGDAAAALAALPSGDDLDVAAVAASWDVAPLGLRRRFLAVFVDEVVVHPASVAERVVVKWRA